jgi:hypothetical protein
MDKPVMAWPFRMTANNTIAYVEQDTVEEVEQCVGFIFSTRPGTLVDDPKLGLPDPIFKQGGVTVGELEAAARAERRAKLSITSDRFAELAQTVGIEVGEVTDA